MRYLIYTLALSFSLNSFALLDANKTNNNIIYAGALEESLDDSELDPLDNIEGLFNYASTYQEQLVTIELYALCESYFQLERIPREWNSDRMRYDRSVHYERLIRRCVSQLSQ